MKQKRKKGERQGCEGPKCRLPHLKLSQKLSQLSQTELTQSTQKKKKKSFLKFSSIFQTPIFQFKILIPKFSIPHSQCTNFKTQIFNFQKKIQTSDFIIKISSFNFQNSKFQNFRFQIPNFKSKSPNSKVSKF